MNIKSLGVVVALILIMFMSAIETSIVSLAIPTIRDDLNVTSSISLIFAVYFIAIVIANPIVGELLDRTKIIYITLLGLLLFTIGSFLSGISGTFEILIMSRFIQGLGAGVMMALSQIVPKLAFEIPLLIKLWELLVVCGGFLALLARFWRTVFRICNVALVILREYSDCNCCYGIGDNHIPF